MIVSRAPFRVSLLGGGSDFPEHYLQHGGAVLGGSINRYCFVTVRQRPKSFGTTFRVRYSRVDEGVSAENVGHPAVREVLRRFQVEGPMDINHSSDLPSRSGVGSSSAFLAATLGGVAPDQLDHLSRYEVASLLHEIERHDLGEIGGHQDAIFSVFGGFNLVEFDQDGFSVVPNRASRSYLKEVASSCFLVYLGNERDSSLQQQGLLAGLGDSRSALVELAHMARECFDLIEREVLLPQDLGRMVAEGWRLKRKTSPGSTNPDIDQLDGTLRSLGAWGGKILGAGGGGFYLSVAPAEVRASFEAHFPNAVTCGFDWDYGGVTVKIV